jgi:hypothetical protein
MFISGFIIQVKAILKILELECHVHDYLKHQNK